MTHSDRPKRAKMTLDKEANLLSAIDAHTNLTTIRKVVCDTLRQAINGGNALTQGELRGLLVAEALAVKALEEALALDKAADYGAIPR